MTSAVPTYVRQTPRRVLGLPPAAWSVVVVIATIAAIDLYARSSLVTRLDIVPVGEMVTRAVELLQDSEFLSQHLGRTAGAIFASFALASVGGIALAYVMTQVEVLRAALAPYIDVFYAVPTFAVYPVLVVLMGSGVLPIILLASTFSGVVVVSEAFIGFTSAPPITMKLSRSLRLTRWQHFRRILMPSAIPDILTGLKLGISYAIIAVLASEFILSSQGLGHLVANAYNTFNTVEMYAGIVLVAVFALVANLVLSFILSRFDWRRR